MTTRRAVDRTIPRHPVRDAFRRARPALAAALLASLALAPAGCVSYANWPPVPDDVALNDPNSPATEEVMMAALRWTISKYPPEERPDLSPPPAWRRGDPEPAPRAVVNLPTGVKPAVYWRVADAAGGLGRGGRGGVVPVTPDNESLPVYHVNWVRIRGDQARISILRPVLGFERPGGSGRVYQELQLLLTGGLRPWTVQTVRPYDLGSREAPALNYYAPPPIATERVVSPPRDGTYTPPRPADPPPAPRSIDREPPSEPAPQPMTEPASPEPVPSQPGSEPVLEGPAVVEPAADPAADPAVDPATGPGSTSPRSSAT